MSRPAHTIPQSTPAPAPAAAEAVASVDSPRGGRAGAMVVRGLSEADLTTLDRVARRMHEALRRFLAAAPESARHASGLARYLRVDRTTCQRAVFVASRTYPGPSLLARLPGVRALRECERSARRARPCVAREVIDDLAAAITQFEHAIRATAGSQTRLSRLLDAAPHTAPHEDDADSGEGATRRKLFEAAALLTGRSSELWVAVYIYAPSERQNLLRLVRANGLLGHTARPDAVPLTFHSFSSKSRGGNVPDPGVIRPLCEPTMGGGSDLPAGLLRSFTSDPPPFVTSKQPNEFLVQAIDDAGGPGSPVDVMFAVQNSVPHPTLQDPATEEAWALINFPARRLVFDVYLHRDLARVCIPSLDAHLWRPDFAQHMGDRWQTRFADAPSIKVLRPGLRGAACDAWARHEELTRTVFDASALDPSAFVGYRCDVEHPIWRAGYCFAFDFAPASRADEPGS